MRTGVRTAVVATVVEWLGTPDGLAKFGDLKALEKALAAKDNTHVLGQLLEVANKAKTRAKGETSYSFGLGAFPLELARQQVVRRFPSPDDATRQNLRKVVTVIVTAVMGGANNNLCERLPKSYCVKGSQLLRPLVGANDMKLIISLAVVAVASAIQNHLEVPGADRVAKQHQVLAILCRCSKSTKSVLTTALRTPLLSSALEALERLAH